MTIFDISHKCDLANLEKSGRLQAHPPHTLPESLPQPRSSRLSAACRFPFPPPRPFVRFVPVAMISSTARRLSAAIRPCVRTKGRVIAPALATGAMSLMATAAGFTRAAPGVARVPHVRALSSSPAAQRSVAQDAADYVKSRLPEGFTPKLGLVLGSGLGPVGDIIEDAVRIPYSEIPDFPVSTVSGHAGELVCGTLEGVPVVALKGRVHLYEGVDPANLRIPIYTFKVWRAGRCTTSTAAVALLTWLLAFHCVFVCAFGDGAAYWGGGGVPHIRRGLDA